jgi:hypothetical protein
VKDVGRHRASPKKKKRGFSDSSPSTNRGLELGLFHSNPAILRRSLGHDLAPGDLWPRKSVPAYCALARTAASRATTSELAE